MSEEKEIEIEVEVEESRDESYDPLPVEMFTADICIICGEKATHRSPVIDQPWVDKLPIILWLRKLYCAPPRHTVMFRGKKNLCAIHRSIAEQMADNEVAERRYAQAELNGSQFRAVHVFNRSLIEHVRMADSEIVGHIEELRQ